MSAIPLQYDPLLPHAGSGGTVIPSAPAIAPAPAPAPAPATYRGTCREKTTLTLLWVCIIMFSNTALGEGGVETLGKFGGKASPAPQNPWSACGAMVSFLVEILDIKI